MVKRCAVCLAAGLDVPAVAGTEHCAHHDASGPLTHQGSLSSQLAERNVVNFASALPQDKAGAGYHDSDGTSTNLTQDMAMLSLDSADIQMLRELVETHVVNVMEPALAGLSLSKPSLDLDNMYSTPHSLKQSLKIVGFSFGDCGHSASLGLSLTEGPSPSFAAAQQRISMGNPLLSGSENRGCDGAQMAEVFNTNRTLDAARSSCTRGLQDSSVKKAGNRKSAFGPWADFPKRNSACNFRVFTKTILRI